MYSNIWYSRRIHPHCTQSLFSLCDLILPVVLPDTLQSNSRFLAVYTTQGNVRYFQRYYWISNHPIPWTDRCVVYRSIIWYSTRIELHVVLFDTLQSISRCLAVLLPKITYDTSGGITGSQIIRYPGRKILSIIWYLPRYYLRLLHESHHQVILPTNTFGHFRTLELIDTVGSINWYSKSLSIRWSENYY